ncbi:MlaD family protein, partial [Actinomadura adrarensis]
MAGLHAGEVTAVEPRFRQGLVRVTWKVDSEVELGRSTRAEVRVENVLGGRYLRLSGPVSSPYLADVPEDRRNIPLERTSTPSTINDVLNEGTRTITRLDTRSIDRILGELGKLNEEDRGRLGRALRNLSELSETVNGSSEQLDKLLKNGDKVLNLARTKERQLDQLLTNIQLMLDELEKRRDELSAFVGGTGNTVASMSRLIDQQQKQLTTVISDLRSTLGTLRPTTGDFNELLAWAGPTLSGLAGTGGYGPWLEVVA